MIKDFFTFKRMISTFIIKIIYVLGIVGIFVSGLYTYSTDGVKMALIVVVIGNLLWRLLCEVWIVLFSIHKRLVDLEEMSGSRPPDSSSKKE